MSALRWCSTVFHPPPVSVSALLRRCCTVPCSVRPQPPCRLAPHCIALVAARSRPSGFDDKALSRPAPLQTDTTLPTPSSSLRRLAHYLTQRSPGRRAPVVGETRRVNLASSQTGYAFATEGSRPPAPRTSLRSGPPRPLITATSPPQALSSLAAPTLPRCHSTRRRTRDVIDHGIRDQVPRGLGRR